MQAAGFCFARSSATEGFTYAIRLPADGVLQERIGYLLKRPGGRPPVEVPRYHASFSYRAQSCKVARRVVAKVEWHPGELHPRVGFVVTNISASSCARWRRPGRSGTNPRPA